VRSTPPSLHLMIVRLFRGSQVTSKHQLVSVLKNMPTAMPCNSTRVQLNE
jgi:hypothetical protein